MSCGGTGITSRVLGFIIAILAGSVTAEPLADWAPTTRFVMRSGHTLTEYDGLVAEAVFNVQVVETAGDTGVNIDWSLFQ